MDEKDNTATTPSSTDSELSNERVKEVFACCNKIKDLACGICHDWDTCKASGGSNHECCIGLALLIITQLKGRAWAQKHATELPAMLFGEAEEGEDSNRR